MYGSAIMLLTAGICRADVSDAIARCAAIESKDERIACLEQALRAASSNPRAVRSEPGRIAAPAPAPARPPVAAPRRPPPAAIPEPAPAAPPGSAQSEPAPPGASFGSEQLEQPGSADAGDEILKAKVVDFAFVGYRRLLVQLDNGQVWRQIKGDRTTVDWGLRDDETFDVELWKAVLGGYRMRVIPVDRIIRVERLK